jgi:hypothetical protein
MQLGGGSRPWLRLAGYRRSVFHSTLLAGDPPGANRACGGQVALELLELGGAGLGGDDRGALLVQFVGEALLRALELLEHVEQLETVMPPAVLPRAGTTRLTQPMSGAARFSQERARKRPAKGRPCVPGMLLRSEVDVLSWGPDRGNPTSMWQGRGPEVTGRLVGVVVWRRWASVRAG